MLKTLWQNISKFMVYRSDPRLQAIEPDLEQGYGSWARFYAFLPAIEEQRHWLETIYRRLR